MMMLSRAFGWRLAVLMPDQRKRNTHRTAHTGLAWTLLLVVSGVCLLAAAVVEFSEYPQDSSHLRAESFLWWSLLVGWFPLLAAILGIGSLVLAVETGRLAVRCYASVMYGESVAESAAHQAVLDLLQAVPEAERKQAEQRGQQAGKTLLRWYRGLFLGFSVVFAVTAFLDGSVFLALARILLRQHGVVGLVLGILAIWGALFSLGLFSLLPLGLLYVIAALVQARWGPAKQPWFAIPPGSEAMAWFRPLFGLSPLGRTAAVRFWLLILLAGLGLTAFEMYLRLASGAWPRSTDPPNGDFLATWLLALAVCYVLLSLLRLVQIARSRPQEESPPSGQP
jgi:hypothetical protein